MKVDDPTPLDHSLPKVRELLVAVREIIEQLDTIFANAQTLDAMLTICADCKRIRDEQDNWQPVADYIYDHTGTCFSHGLCPTCYGKARGLL